MPNGVFITIIGNCTRDPELRFTSSGMAVASFGVATNFRKMNRQTNEWEDEEPTFYDVTCFQQMAENAAESISKGMRLMVNGRVRSRSWEGRDGERRTSLEIVADEVGPSVRYATVDVTRNERRGGEFGSSAPASRAPSSAPAAGNYADDEEPF